MKNKKAVYILLPLVILIWGIIFYRIFKGTSGSQYKVQTPKVESTRGKLTSDDSFSIYANYADPFLKNIREKKKLQKSKKSTQQNNKRNISSRRRRRTITRWPQIRYKGIVRNQEKTKHVFLVEIKKSSFLVHPGDTLKNVIIENCYEDSIVVSYEGKKKTIERENH